MIAFHSNQVKSNPICGNQDSNCGHTNRSVQVKRYIWQVPNCNNTSLYWTLVRSHLIWWLKSWINLKQNSKSHSRYGYLILPQNTQNTEWLTYSHLLTGRHSTLKEKTLTKAMCTNYSLGVDIAFEVLNIFGISMFINCLCLLTTFP